MDPIIRREVLVPATRTRQWRVGCLVIASLALLLFGLRQHVGVESTVPADEVETSAIHPKETLAKVHTNVNVEDSEKAHDADSWPSELDSHCPKCELKISFPSKISRSATIAYLGHGGIRYGAEVAYAEIINHGTSTLALVMPGEGSRATNVRTPIVRWSILRENSKAKHPDEPPPPSHDLECGNLDGLSKDDVFVLSPGEKERVGFPYEAALPSLRPGKYRIKYYYTNDPELGLWPTSFNDPIAANRVPTTASVSLVSNEVHIQVTK